MQYELDRTGDEQGEPSLTEMVDKSIRLLSRSTNGYMLLVEGQSHDTVLAVDNVVIFTTK
jgi:alkaline phosphatase